MKEIYEAVNGLFPLVPNREGWQRPRYVIAEWRQYRGKRRYVVGYGHSRIGSHHLSGRVHDRILGYGNDAQEALAMMRSALGQEPTP